MVVYMQMQISLDAFCIEKQFNLYSFSNCRNVSFSQNLQGWSWSCSLLANTFPQAQKSGFQSRKQAIEYVQTLAELCPDLHIDLSKILRSKNRYWRLADSPLFLCGDAGNWQVAWDAKWKTVPSYKQKHMGFMPLYKALNQSNSFQKNFSTRKQIIDYLNALMS